MKKISLYILLFLLPLAACKEVLEPEPIDIQIDELALNGPEDVENVRIGLYGSFRGLGAPVIIAGDYMADLLTHNGTFSQYREIGNKQLTSSNGSVSDLWGSIYGTVYMANFVLERLPTISGVPQQQRRLVTATAHFLRGYAYFIGAHTFGGIPLVTSTNLTANRNIPRATKEEVLALVLSDYQQALNSNALPDEPSNGFASVHAVRAALARYYLYNQQWALAEQYASEVINSGKFTLASSYAQIVEGDFTSESIFELGYTTNNDPETLYSLFQVRREIIPANQYLNTILFLNRAESGERIQSVKFDPLEQSGNDNGWAVNKYQSSETDNNNIIVFRLAEMYLIRAEARAQQGRVVGADGAQEDINVLRRRAKASLVSVNTPAQMLQVIERERLYELAFEGHRWYDLVRTGRANVVLTQFSPNWKETFNLWPIPLSEIQRNPALANAQNPGY